MNDDELTDDPAIPVFETEDVPERPPAIDPWTVPGADGLPDDVRNGEPEGETHPSVDHEPVIEDKEI